MIMFFYTSLVVICIIGCVYLLGKAIDSYEANIKKDTH
ncbi:hypothetical protein GHNINEIG_01486 [Hydrogenovibrio crunogenus]|uniref:Uncharacterized protein n=1 Tax=Hydrogenovibrio crunogenus TaxID=39765 RepID=A0A4P7NZX7_9GAMM|nr:hypothetical protein GHNINEIG_01486 [Hydrogenovibrio crunogenus]